MKISIITATYNSASTLQDTIDSVRKQKYHHIEHIIVDGGSKDETINILKENERELQEEQVNNISFRWISEPDQGIYDAMNKGIKMASGSVLGVLNSDDFFTSDDVIQKVAEAFEKNPQIDALYGDVHFVKTTNLQRCTRYYSSRYFKPRLLKYGFMPAHPSFYARKEVFEKYGLYDLQYQTSSDFEMMVRLFLKNHIKTKYLNMDFVTMRAGGASTANLQSKKNVYNDVAAALKMHGIYSNRLLQSVRYGWRVLEIIHTRLIYK